MSEELTALLKTMDEDEQYDFFREGVRKRYPAIQDIGEQKLIQAISIAFEDTPKSLYRFLYLWEPKDIDFSDMYKSRVAVIRIHKKGVVRLALYKYELAAYLFVTPDQIRQRREHDIEISCGVPGFENEALIEDSEVYKEFQIFRGLLEMEHDVYPGNDFVV